MIGVVENLETMRKNKLNSPKVLGWEAPVQSGQAQSRGLREPQSPLISDGSVLTVTIPCGDPPLF